MSHATRGWVLPAVVQGLLGVALGLLLVAPAHDVHNSEGRELHGEIIVELIHVLPLVGDDQYLEACRTDESRGGGRLTHNVSGYMGPHMRRQAAISGTSGVGL